MRILAVHNYYKEPGGERRVFQEESDLLTSYGHDVRRYTANNDEIDDIDPLTLAKRTIWNSEVYRELGGVIRDVRPDVMHVHNTVPVLSPAVYHAAHDEGVAVVQTLHNYRLMCPAGVFFRDGQVCEDCMGKTFAWPAILHGCYRNDRAASSVLAAMVTAHEAVDTWKTKVDRYIALTEFARSKFTDGRLPAEKVVTKPNFVYPDPGIRDSAGNYALFVGRVAKGKGVLTLAKAWRQVGSGLPLKLVGDGPLLPELKRDNHSPPHVRFLGRRPSEEVFDLMGKARVVIVPSQWYETFGRVVAEAFAVGTPVIVSNIGAIAELVDHGRTGRLFDPGCPEHLAEQVDWMRRHPGRTAQMGAEARREYEKFYAADRNYEMLMDIYRSVTTTAAHEAVET